MKYEKNAGLKIYSDAFNYFVYHKFEFLVALIVLVIILNKSLLPNNLILNIVSLFINSLSVVNVNLNLFTRFYLGFKLGIFSIVMTWIVQFFFVFLIVRAVSSLFRKRKTNFNY